MKFVSTLRDTLPEAEVKRLEALGMKEKLEEEIEVDAKAYVAEVVSKAVAELTETVKALQEEVAEMKEQLKEAPASEEAPAEETSEAEKEAPSEEVEETLDEEKEFTEDELTVMKGLLQQIEDIKKALD